MKIYISLLAIFLLTGAAFKEKTITNPATVNERPNIVLIMADDMGFSDRLRYNNFKDAYIR